MPFVLCDCRDVDEHVIARVVIEVRRPLYYEVSNPRRQQQAGANVRLPSLGAEPDHPDESFEDVNYAGDDEPFPEVRSVENDQHPEGDVEQMGPVEYLKMWENQKVAGVGGSGWVGVPQNNLRAGRMSASI